MIGCRADGLRSLRERYAVVARRACEKPISRRGKRVNVLHRPGGLTARELKCEQCVNNEGAACFKACVGR